MVICSDLTVNEKFSLIDKSFFSSTQANLLYGFLYPLLTTAFMIFAYPYPAKFVYAFWSNRQKELKEARQKIDDETPMTKEEAREIRKETAKLELEYEAQLKKKNEDIKTLKEIIEEMHVKGSEIVTDVNVVNEQVTPPDSKLSKDVITHYLKVVAESHHPYLNNLSYATQDGNIKTKYVLDELVNMGLLSYEYNDEDADFFYSPTHSGREMLVYSGTLNPPT